MERILAGVESWLPIVRQHRPLRPWGDVVRLLNASGESRWTAERLRRTVRRLVAEGMAERDLLERAPRRNVEDRLATLVAGIAAAMPGATLQQIASRLQSVQERAPGGSIWLTS
jgi:hypothetical protein